MRGAAGRTGTWHATRGHVARGLWATDGDGHVNVLACSSRRAGASSSLLIARGSAMECLGVLDVALGRGLVTAAAHRHGRGLLIRVVQMLTKLSQRMQA